MNEKKITIAISIASIVMQIVTGMIVANVTAAVIQTKMETTQREVDRLRSWREQVVDPALAKQAADLGIVKQRVNDFHPQRTRAADE